MGRTKKVTVNEAEETKNKLIASIREKMNDTEFQTLGITVYDPLEKLQEISDGLHVHVHETPEETEKPEEIEKFEEKETPEEKEIPEEKPEETEKPAEEKNEYDELIGKISGATPPEKKEKKERPIVERKQRKTKKGASDPNATRIEGFILLIAVDTVFPFGLAFLNNMIDKKHKQLEPQQLQLDQKSFDKLEPLADQAADYLSFNINPVAGFFIASSLMYANNMIAIKMKNEQ
jgi:hypothetical protein